MNAPRCSLCDYIGLDVRVSLVEWVDVEDGLRFQAIPRCQDRKACRTRLEAAGERWPVIDARWAA